MDGCYWKVTTSGQTALKVGSTARIYNSTLIGAGAGYAIDGTSATVEIAHCGLSTNGICTTGGHVTNSLGTNAQAFNAIISA